MLIRIRYLFDLVSGVEKFGSGIKIPNPQHCLQLDVILRTIPSYYIRHCDWFLISGSLQAQLIKT
jgi:hypothetical protein